MHHFEVDFYICSTSLMDSVDRLLFVYFDLFVLLFVAELAVEPVAFVEVVVLEELRLVFLQLLLPSLHQE